MRSSAVPSSLSRLTRARGLNLLHLLLDSDPCVLRAVADSVLPVTEPLFQIYCPWCLLPSPKRYTDNRGLSVPATCVAFMRVHAHAARYLDMYLPETWDSLVGIVALGMWAPGPSRIVHASEMLTRLRLSRHSTGRRPEVSKFLTTSSRKTRVNYSQPRCSACSPQTGFRSMPSGQLSILVLGPHLANRPV